MNRDKLTEFMEGMLTNIKLAPNKAGELGIMAVATFLGEIAVTLDEINNKINKPIEEEKIEIK